MAQSVFQEGAQTTTPGSDTPLHTWTAPTGGAMYVLVVDHSALVNSEVLWAYFERMARVGGTRRELWRTPIAAHAGGGVSESVAFRAPAGIECRVGLRLEGVAARVINWSLERIDG